MKRPSFQFYPADWLSSAKVAMMTPEQEGAYIRLLCYAWMDPDCSIPDDDEQLATLSRLGEGWLKGSSTTLQQGAGRVVRLCFETSPNLPGRLVHRRLLEEREKQDKWREKCISGGKKSGETRSQAPKTIENKGKKNETKGSSRVVEGYLNYPSTGPVEGYLNTSSSSSSSSSLRKEKIEKEKSGEETGSVARPTGGQPAQFSFPLDSGKTWNLKPEDLLSLEEAFPEIDVPGEMRKAVSWLNANPSRRKTAKGMPRFINNWLGRTEQRGKQPQPPSNGQAQGLERGRPANMDEIFATIQAEADEEAYEEPDAA